MVWGRVVFCIHALLALKVEINVAKGVQPGGDPRLANVWLILRTAASTLRARTGLPLGARRPVQ